MWLNKERNAADNYLWIDESKDFLNKIHQNFQQKMTVLIIYFKLSY